MSAGDVDRLLPPVEEGHVPVAAAPHTFETFKQDAEKNFLVQINEKAEALGVSLTVEHLLPGLQKVITSEKNPPEKLQLYVRLLFKEMTRLIGFLSRSEITAGYNGIRENRISK